MAEFEFSSEVLQDIFVRSVRHQCRLLSELDKRYPGAPPRAATFLATAVPVVLIEMTGVADTLENLNDALELMGHDGG